jgi:hypothetical protein
MSIFDSTNFNEVFFITPRDGYKKGNLWIPRKEENELSSYLDDLGVNICIDGPTGTGKSSLALTILKRKKVDFLLVIVTKSMTWKDFCRQLLKANVNDDSALEWNVELGIDKGLPLFKLHFGMKPNMNSLDEFELEDRIIDRMTDDTISQVLYERKVALLIDNFEQASEDIQINVSEMCRLLTQKYISQKTRIVIVGTDDIYRRLRKNSRALEGRLKEIGIGTIQDWSHAWKFLLDGFNKLKLSHPASDFENKINNVTERDLNDCRISCYEAADGLLKSLNELGKTIVKNATVNNRISPATIKNVCKTYIDSNIKTFSLEFTKFANTLKGNALAKLIALYFYEKGIGQFHNWNEVLSGIKNKTKDGTFEKAIDELVNIGFLTRTGFEGEILNVTDPTFAHLVGTIIRHPAKYDVPLSLKLDSSQYVLEL